MDNLQSTRTKSRRNDNGTSTPLSLDAQREDPVPPHHGPRPIIDMVLCWSKGKQRKVRVLLDTGSTAALLDKEFTRRYKVPTMKRDKPLHIRNFSNEVVKDAGEFFTVPYMLQHRKHFTSETFEVAPLDSDCDVILPYWWMAKHQPCNLWGQGNEITFTTPHCLEKCTKANADAFSVKVDKRVLDHSEALVIGHISAVATKEELSEAIQLVPEKFRKWISIMTKETADRLPEHKPYDHAIDLKERETPPWGPVYALNETEL
jgi:hypothetical protein